ncbi:PREDICTED: nucleolin-like [Tarenaya hassleriana]|uniref:nucleolin-like n=1 Tax=Tarenaya hassleriana TaxID=28532 RepID=UPI0008FD8B90|nr:PREDICTED: nucleolin-like [Tarenaya hassleriana]
MFGTNGRKRSGSGYDNNHEPSSPKVTCIGQVRVKTRKHVKKKMRARSTRKGETSFRRSTDQSDGGGGRGGCRFDASENRSSCTDDSHRRDRDGRQTESDACGGGSSCGAVFTRWFVAVEETGGKRREIELVVGGEDDAEQDQRQRSRRRHVFEGLDFSELEVKPEKKEKEEEAGRIAICAPPKNALLLMRCRSDPVKVAALANKVRETQKSLSDDAKAEEEDNGVAAVEEEIKGRRRVELEMEDKKRIEICEKWISGEIAPDSEVAEAEPALVSRVEKEEEEVKAMEDSVVKAEESKVLEEPCEEEMEATFMRNIEDDIRHALEEDEQWAEMTDLAAKEEEDDEDIDSATQNEERSEPGDPDNPKKPEPDPNPAPEGRENQPEATEKETAPYKVLPDCLLLMMCEPKLSMEVSKETWVCSTDFVRWLPERPPAKKPDGGGRDQHKKRTATAAESTASSRRRSTDKPFVNPVLLQPPRSSCSIISE